VDSSSEPSSPEPSSPLSSSAEPLASSSSKSLSKSSSSKSLSEPFGHQKSSSGLQDWYASGVQDWYSKRLLESGGGSLFGHFPPSVHLTPPVLGIFTFLTRFWFPPSHAHGDQDVQSSRVQSRSASVAPSKSAARVPLGVAGSNPGGGSSSNCAERAARPRV